MNLPQQYQWLIKEESPRHLLKALELYGITESVGEKDNPIILEWAKELGIEKVYTADSIAWCGLFAAIIMKRAGREPVDKPLWALNWANFGVKVEKPMLGDVLVFKRNGGGHVGLYCFETNNHYGVLGGNQGDKVCIVLIAKSRLYQSRRPSYKNQPLNIRRILLDDKLAPISNNEA